MLWFDGFCPPYASRFFSASRRQKHPNIVVKNRPNIQPTDIVFVIKTKLHPRFKREGNDLSCTVVITLEQALSGFSIPVETLDGRTVTAREPGIPSSSHETVIKGEGMPSQKDRRVRGDLAVRYSVEFPPPARSQADKRKRQQALADL